MADLVTSTAVKAFLSIAHTDDDTLIASLVNYVSSAIESYCHREFTSGAHTEYLDGGESLIVKHLPITAITGIYDTFDSDLVVDADNYDYDGGAGLIYPSQSSEFYWGGEWSAGRRRWKVVYTGGYAAVPDDVSLAACTWIADIYEARDDLKSGSLGDKGFLRASAVSIHPMPDRCQGILDHYRLVAI